MKKDAGSDELIVEDVKFEKLNNYFDRVQKSLNVQQDAFVTIDKEITALTNRKLRREGLRIDFREKIKNDIKVKLKAIAVITNLKTVTS